MKNLLFIFLPIFLFVFEVHANETTYSLGVHESCDINSMQNSIRLIESQGGRIVHIFPPHILIGDIPAHIPGFKPVQPKDVGLRNIYQGIIELSAVEDLGQEARFAVKVWNQRFEDVNDRQDACPTPDPGPIQNDCLVWQPKEKSPPQTSQTLQTLQTLQTPQTLQTSPYGASFYETSEYMMGKVAVGIILPESNGSGEDWIESEEIQVVSEIMAAFDWWKNKEPDAYLSFTYELHKKIPTTYEPITLNQSQESLWMKETIDIVHPNSYSLYLDKVTDYDNYLRNTYQTHWGFTIFVVDSSTDADGKFANGYFAYAYLGGPLMVMTYDNDGYGINNMDVVTSHEMGHVFYALDEYTGSGSSADDRSGYLNIVNGNFAVDGIINVPCIMRGGLSPYTNGEVCTYTRQQSGWRDTDKDNILDIMDTYPISVLNVYTPDPTTDNTPTYNGNATVNPYPNNNPKRHGNDISLNLITNVQYRINKGNWTDTVVTDGVFDEGSEDFYFTTPPLGQGSYTFEVKAGNSCGTQTVVNIEQPPYASDTLTIIDSLLSTGSQTITGSVLKITVFDDGTMGIWKKDKDAWMSQVFDDNSKGSVIFLAGTNTNYRYASKANTFDITPTQWTPVSNTKPGSFTISTIYDTGTTAVKIKQITTYIDGLDYYKMEWQITNNGTTTYNDVRFFHGEDTYFSGNDWGYGHWNEGLNMVYVTNPQQSKTGIMGLYGGGLSPATSYYENSFEKVVYQTKQGYLLNTVNEKTEHDAAYVLGWQSNSLSPGQTWKIVAYERITTAGGVIVLGPADQEASPEGTLTYFFSVYNNQSKADTFNLFATSSNSWQTRILDMTNNSISSVSLGIGTSTMLKVLLTLPQTVKPGTLDLLTFVARSQTNSQIAGTVSAMTTVIPGSLDHIKINPATATIEVSKTMEFTGQGCDRYDNPIPDLIFNWVIDNIGTITSQVSEKTLFTAGITPCIGTISAWIGTVTGTAMLKIIPGALNEIKITPATGTLAIGETMEFHAQGYDKYTNPIPDLIYIWFTINMGNLSPTIGSSTLLTATTSIGSGIITVKSSERIAFASITITSGPVHHINILPATQTLQVLGTCSFQAQGYDRFNNPILDLSYKWQVSSLVGSITPELGSITVFTAGTKALVGTLSVFSGTLTGIATITITAGEVEHLIITPSTATVTVGKSLKFNAMGYDQYNNVVENLNCLWHPSPDLGTVTLLIGSKTTFIAGTSPITGTLSVRLGTITVIATITVIPGNLHHLIITPPEAVIVVTQSQEFSVKAYDEYDNLILDSGYTWTVTPGLGSITTTTGSKTTFVAGTVAILMGTLSVTTGSVTQIATLTIIPYPLDYICLTPELATITVTQAQQFNAQGYDMLNNLIPNLSYSWEIAQSLGELSTIIGSVTTFTAGTKTKTGTLAVTVGTITAMGTITIAPGTLACLFITPSISTVPITQSREFSVQGSDQYLNFIPELEVNWQVHPKFGTVSPCFGSKTIFTAETMATIGTISAILNNITAVATITTTPEAEHHLIIIPALATVTAGTSQEFSVKAYDEYDNLILDFACNWQVTPELGTTTPTIGSKTTFLAGTTAMIGTLTASAGTITQIAVITLIPPVELQYLVITPSFATVSVNSPQEFRVQGYNKFDNPIPDLIYHWQVNTSVGKVEPLIGTMTTFTAGTKTMIGSLTVTSGTITAIATITIMPGELQYLALLPSVATVAVTQGVKFSVIGYDRYRNLIPNQEVNWQVSEGSGVVSPLFGVKTTWTAGTIAGTGTLTASRGSVSNTAKLTIIPGAVWSLHISPSSAYLTVTTTLKFSARGYDQFDNFIPNLDYFWQIDEGIGKVTPAYGTMTTLTAGTRASYATLTVTSGLIRQQASITITPGALFKLEVFPSTLSIRINSEATFTTKGYDQYHNPVPNVFCNWFVPAELGTVTPTGILATFTANSRLTNGIIQAVYGIITETATIFLMPGDLDHFDFGTISHQVGGIPFPATITARDSYNNLVNFAGEIRIFDARGETEFPANGKFVAGIWAGTITMTEVGLAIRIIATSGNVWGTSNAFASLIDDNYGTVTVVGNTTLSINPKSLKGRNYLVLIDFNPKNTAIDHANLEDDKDPKFGRVPDSIREINIVDGDNNPLNYEFGSITILTIPFQDNDRDGMVDGTNIIEKSLKMYFLQDNQWKEVNIASTIDPIDHQVISPIFRMGTYILMGYSLQTNLTDVVVYPVPFKPQRGDNRIIFEGLTTDSRIRIYDIAGSLRRYIENIDGYWEWDVTDDYGKPLESGVYIYIITDNEEGKKVGKIVVIR
ncbi:MAG: hypothetical protein ABIF11_04355 [Nitrospirota bacterium]